MHNPISEKLLVELNLCEVSVHYSKKMVADVLFEVEVISWIIFVEGISDDSI